MTNLERFAKAFQMWEEEYRLDQVRYLTSEQASRLGVSELSADRAAVFTGFLSQVGD